MVKRKDLRFFWEIQQPRPSKVSISFPQIRTEKSIPIRVAETAQEVVIRAEMGDFKKSDIDINVTESYVEIAASKRSERINASTLTEDRQASGLRRAFSLPSKVDPDQSEAILENGTLLIILHKPQRAEKKKRKIEIK